MTRVLFVLGVSAAVLGAPAAARTPQTAASRPPQTQAPASLLTPAETARVRAYHDRIVVLARDIATRASLAALVRPLFALAVERSAAGGAATDENRAAILALAVYANGRNLALLVPESRTWPRAEWRGLVLGARGDLVQHFTLSAVVAAAAGAPIAHAIGLYKELDDARGGSGFSFVDLTADRAGTSFGLMATLSAASARTLQARVADGLEDGDLLPDVSGLPERISQEEFRRRFGSIRSASYARMVEEIDRRVAALALFQPPS